MYYIGDTDSLKLFGNYDKSVIENYNKSVIERIQKVCDERGIDINKFKPKDVKGKERWLGIFDNDRKLQSGSSRNGAKKYAYIDKKDNEIHITVAGVPKKGAKALKNLKDFNDDFVFSHEDTGKNLLIYNDDMQEFELEDYQGNVELLKNKYGCVLVPTTYVLGKSQEYAQLISDESSERAIFNEEVFEI